MSFVQNKDMPMKVGEIQIDQVSNNVAIIQPQDGPKVREGADTEYSGSLFQKQVVVAPKGAETSGIDIGLQGGFFKKYPHLIENVAALPDDRKGVVASFLNGVFDLGLISDYYFVDNRKDQDLLTMIDQMTAEKLQALLLLSQGFVKDLDSYIDETSHSLLSGQKGFKKLHIRSPLLDYMLVLSKEPQNLWGKCAELLKEMIKHVTMLWRSDYCFFFAPYSIEDAINLCRDKDIPELHSFVKERFAYFSELHALYPDEFSGILELSFLRQLVPVDLLSAFHNRVNELFKESGYVAASTDSEMSVYAFGLLPVQYVDKNSLHHLENNFWVFNELKGEMTLDELREFVWSIVSLLSLTSFTQHQTDLIKKMSPFLLKCQFVQVRFWVVEVLLRLPIESQHKLLGLCENELAWAELQKTFEEIALKAEFESREQENDYDIFHDIHKAILDKIHLDMNDLETYWIELLKSSDDDEVRFIYHYLDEAEFSSEHDEFMQALNEAGIRLGYLDEASHPYNG